MTTPNQKTDSTATTYPQANSLRVGLQQYKQRWSAVAQIELAEQQQSTTQERWQQFNALFQMATALTLLNRSTAQDEEIVWQRWTKLRTILTRSQAKKLSQC